jgi:hypothetical protein
MGRRLMRLDSGSEVWALLLFGKDLMCSDRGISETMIGFEVNSQQSSEMTQSLVSKDRRKV